jgi:hypothetical protein
MTHHNAAIVSGDGYAVDSDLPATGTGRLKKASWMGRLGCESALDRP